MSTDASIDEFAQTRAPDDLFDDDFTPVTEPTILAQSHHTAVPSGPRLGRGENSQRGGRGRGRGRGRGANESNSEAKAEGASEKPERKEATPTSRGDRAPMGDRTATGGVAKVRLPRIPYSHSFPKPLLTCSSSPNSQSQSFRLALLPFD
jgi:hypothetical protein